MFKRRIGPHPHAGPEDQPVESPGTKGCPDIWELDDGSFAVIGIDRTADLLPHLPSDASCGPDERIVIVNRTRFVRSREAIPDA